MSVYTQDHAGALSDLAAAGASVTFTTYLPGEISQTTGLTSMARTRTVTGAAIRTQGRKAYQALGLSQTENPVLLFAPTTFGELPALGSSIVWGPSTWTVKALSPIAPDGTAIAAYIELDGGGANAENQVVGDGSLVGDTP